MGGVHPLTPFAYLCDHWWGRVAPATRAKPQAVGSRAITHYSGEAKETWGEDQQL